MSLNARRSHDHLLSSSHFVRITGLAFALSFTTVVIAGPGETVIRVDPFWKDVVEVVSWSVAIVGGLVAAGRAIHESRENRKQREHALTEAREARTQRSRELRWRQAQVGTELVEKCQEDPMAWDAMLMIDWSVREFALPNDLKVVITSDDVDRALRPTRGEFDDKEAYIREAFDSLFFRYSAFERALAIELVTLDDVSSPATYYIGEMAKRRDVFEAYMKAFGFDATLRFLQRFPAWNPTAA